MYGEGDAAAVPPSDNSSHRRTTTELHMQLGMQGSRAWDHCCGRYPESTGLQGEE